MDNIHGIIIDLFAFLRVCALCALFFGYFSPTSLRFQTLGLEFFIATQKNTIYPYNIALEG
jgi:hypothetical protein